MRIGIAGAGGIGSNVAVHLVRSGVTDLTVVDFDRVEISNLNRQFYFHDQIGRPKVEMLVQNLRRINPDVKIEAVERRLTAENVCETFADCPIVVEGFDGQADKKMILEVLAASNIFFVVAASGVAGHDLEKVRPIRMGNSVIVGDLKTDVHQAKLYSHKVGLIAARMADVVLAKIGMYRGDE